MDENAQRTMIAKFNRQGKRVQFDAYHRNEQYKRAEEKRIRCKRPKNHAVEIELTKRQIKELLYVAFKPTKKDLCLKRYSFKRNFFSYFREKLRFILQLVPLHNVFWNNEPSWC